VENSYLGELAEFLCTDLMAFFELRAYCDESYANPTDDRHVAQPFVIGAYVGPVKTWKKLEREWKRLLRKENLPYFHATEVESGWGDVFGYLKDDDKERERLQQLFYNVVNRFEIYAVVSGVPQEEFGRLYSALAPYKLPVPVGKKKKLKPMVTPYLFALEGCFHAVFARLVGHEEKQVGFIFDQEDDHEARAQIVRNQLATSSVYANAHRLGRLTYQSNKIAVALQVADLVAYECMREIREPNSDRWQLRLLEKRRTIHREYLDKKKVDEFLGRIDAYLEKHGPPTLPPP
jgi:hypothetical protein